MHLIENLTYALHHVPASRAQARHHFLHTSFVESSLRSRRILAFDVQNFSGLVLSAQSFFLSMAFPQVDEAFPVANLPGAASARARA
jgi:hypothetical protein